MRILKMASLALLLVGLSLSNALAQKDKSKRPSPPDQVSRTVSGTKITIDYSQPSLKGRSLNTLAPVGKVWRTGANEASWIEFSSDVYLEGKKVKKGRYGLFTINNKSKWTIILNEVWDQWGHYDYNELKDVARFDVVPETAKESVEKFTIDIKDKGQVSLKWGDQVISFQVVSPS